MFKYPAIISVIQQTDRNTQNTKNICIYKHKSSKSQLEGGTHKSYYFEL